MNSETAVDIEKNVFLRSPKKTIKENKSLRNI